MTEERLNSATWLNGPRYSPERKAAPRKSFRRRHTQIPLCEAGGHFQFLARGDDEVVSGGPHLVVDQHLEGDRGGHVFCDQRQVLPSTQASGTPCSHVKPDPCPRRKTALPKPTSILTSMVVSAPEADFGALEVEVVVVLSVGFRAATAALFFVFIV
jgi:hypothetical protein